MIQEYSYRLHHQHPQDGIALDTNTISQLGKLELQIRPHKFCCLSVCHEVLFMVAY